MNFLKTINNNQKKNIKLYAEADTEPEVPEIEFEEPEETEPPVEPEENITVEENTEETFDNMENLDFDGDGDSDTGEMTEEFDTQDPTLEEDIQEFDDSELGFMGEEENMFSNGEDENTPTFRRKVRMLATAYTKLYDTYRGILDKLESKDLAGDRAIILNKYIDEYRNALASLADYLRDNDDSFVVRFQTFVEYRALFISINNKINNIEKEVSILS